MPLALASRVVEERNSSRKVSPRTSPVGTRPELEGIGVGMAVPFTLIWKLSPLLLVDAVEAAGILDCPPHPGAAVLPVRPGDAENEVQRCVSGALENDEIVGARVERGAGGRGERVHGVVRVAGRGRQGVLQGIQRAVGGRGVDVDGECLPGLQAWTGDIDPDRSQAVAAGIRPGVEPLGVGLVLVASCHAGSNGRVYAPPGVADEHVGGRGGGAGDTGGVAGVDGVDGGDAVVAGVAGGEAGVGVGGVGGGGVGGEVGPGGGAVGGDLDLVPGDGDAAVVGGGRSRTGRPGSRLSRWR